MLVQAFVCQLTAPPPADTLLDILTVEEMLM